MTVKELSKRIKILEKRDEECYWNWVPFMAWDYSCREELDAAIAETQRKDPNARIMIWHGQTKDGKEY